MSKRNAIRIGPDPHSADSVHFAVKRYGPIKPETLEELVAWLETPEAKAERTYEVIYETISDLAEDGGILHFPTIKTQRIGSFVFKILDNEHDAQNTLANIRNKDFPNNKQGQ